ncbi:outer membrane protein with beta-barrel domain [Aquimarina intermedia]|uniref:Outer membrane protein with beta-barrel domain n=2 Tax=Aquimarina intermedia TaxID=350814 RepID=A0A5S5BV78_9FLAO|nr:outer membrane protein with beta-barrel domain [Aquimarina intermedia]
MMCAIHFAQDKPIRIAVHYPISLSDNANNVDGIVGANIKYSIYESPILTLGASYTLDYFRNAEIQNVFEVKNNAFFNHLDLYSEFKLPGIQKLHPYVSLGYTLLYNSFESTANDFTYSENDMPFQSNEKTTDSSHGANLKLGLSYDITSVIFIQTYYQYLKIFDKEIYYEGVDNVAYNHLTIGIGFKF